MYLRSRNNWEGRFCCQVQRNECTLPSSLHYRSKTLWVGLGPTGQGQGPLAWTRVLWAVFVLVPLPCRETSGVILLAGGAGWAWGMDTWHLGKGIISLGLSFPICEMDMVADDHFRRWWWELYEPMRWGKPSSWRRGHQAFWEILSY